MLRWDTNLESENKIVIAELEQQITNNYEKYKNRGWVFASELLEGTILDPKKDRLFFYDMKGVILK